MVDSRARTGKTQDEAGASCSVRKKGSAQTRIGYFTRTQEPTGRNSQ